MKIHSRLLRPALLLAAAVALGAPPGLRAPRFDPDRYLSHVKYLASPELKGRGTGTPELEKAGRYIASEFRKIGLLPLNGKSYLQPLEVTTNAKLGRNNKFEYSLQGRTVALNSPADFQPFNFSDTGTWSGEVVFAGFGITAPEYHYDDYAEIDVKDKFVIVMRHEPQEFDEKSVFSGKIYTEHAQFFSKASNAKMHGARGVILVNDVGNHAGAGDEMEPFGSAAGPANAGFPFVQVKASVVDRWLASSGRSVASLQEAIDRDLKPRSFPIAGLTLTVHTDLRREQRTVHNVVGYLPGETDEYLVLGAHYDHLGLGEQFSLAPSKIGTPHLGADDNASGTAAVIELARYFATRPKMKRGILFIAFTAEELGLLGSSFYVNHPLLPLEKAVAMINMDMVGRVRDNKVYVGGTGTSTAFSGMLERVSGQSPMHLDFADVTGYGSSDHTSFTAKQVPVLFFFSGLHGDYHKPSDTWDKIDAPAAARLMELVATTVEAIIQEPERPQFVRVAPPAHSHAAGTGSGGGYGPYFGSIPDFAEPPKGVRFADVREGSPAAKAGLRGGDILIEFDGMPIGNLYDFTYALRGKKPGDRVKVKVLRQQQPLEAEVLLEKRR
jgi:hypothetical protein